MIDLQAGFDLVSIDAIPYYRQWCYDRPMRVGPETLEQMRMIGRALERAVRRFVADYDRYAALMPVSARCRELLALCSEYPYRPGTYRTDFVIDTGRSIRLIEITCRFALNGYFTSGFFARLGCMLASGAVAAQDCWSSFPADLLRRFGRFDRLVLLKDNPRDEGRLMRRIFEAAGSPVTAYTLEEIRAGNISPEGAAVVSQLTIEELLSLPDDILHRLCRTGMLNDPRTAVLIHDKRFFGVLADERFWDGVPLDDEARLLRRCVVPTWTAVRGDERWRQACADPPGWILKPARLGKGEGVVAGCAVSGEAWREALSAVQPEAFVLQPYIEQARWDGTVNGVPRSGDYMVGTLLYMDDRFYGPGLFRASSHPVTNRGDDFKAAPFFSCSGESGEGLMI